jgi:hypothetical protein
MSGLGVSTIHGIVSQVCQSIIENLWKEFVASLMPVVEKDFEEMMVSMNSMWQFPFCWGALDGCHVPLNLHLVVLRQEKNTTISRIFILWS